MKTSVSCLIGLYCFIGSLFAESPPEEQFALLEASDISEAGDQPIRLLVWYNSPSGINRDSGDEFDIWVASQSGFHANTQFLEWLPIRRIGSTAAYELDAPAGGWTREHNGEYAVLLTSGEIENNDGSSFPLTLTGSFKVDITDDKRTVPALAGEVTIETFPTPGVPGGEHHELAIATFTATFPYPVDLSWSDVAFSSTGRFSVNVEACELPGVVPQVVTTYTHRAELGTLGEGAYSVSLKNKEAILDTKQFEIGSSNHLVKGLPSEVQIDIQELPTLGLFPAYSANIRMTFDQYVAETAWGDLHQDGNTLSSEFTAWIDPAVRIFAPMVVEHQVFLGMLEPGEYLLQISSLEEIIARKNFVSGFIGGGDRTPPLVTVHDAYLSDPGNDPLEFSVQFHDPSGLNLAGIEAQSLTAMNWRGEVFPVVGVDFANTEDLPPSGAFATFQMQAPGGSWGPEDRGRYRLLLSDPELVADLAGNHLINPRIGHLTVNIHPDDPEPMNPAELVLVNNEIIGRWTASVRLFVPEDLAVRDDWSINWGAVRPAGPAFFLHPEFVEAGSGNPIALIPPSDTTGAGMWVEHDYDLGPISFGRWPVCLESNLGHFAKEILDAGQPGDGLEPFDLWRDGLDPAGLTRDELWEYLMGTDPTNPADDHLGDPKPEILPGENGARHLGIRCRIAANVMDARLRIQGSSDMNTWVDLGPNQIEEIERRVLEGGIEEIVLCLTDSINASDIRYIRVIAERW